MTELELIRTNPSTKGLRPTKVSLTGANPEGVLTKLKKVPSKISAYFNRHMIREVYRSKPRPSGPYYIIVTKDETFFHVEYA